MNVSRLGKHSNGRPLPLHLGQQLPELPPRLKSDLVDRSKRLSVAAITGGGIAQVVSEEVKSVVLKPHAPACAPTCAFFAGKRGSPLCPLRFQDH
jgi:hypothetical protein